ncbi:hypothetical protein VitviT2T_020342 [Vitis vinifera]|uniref:Retrovirus-related Pol polyprotein from transposon RE1 n=1 Tax=Vitis vinifera TaxID=29760 RepID=A0ABY9D3F0_VITVI|nr:hypothetical protein VitviT2T_020342 [Vitis vinifera]
MKEELDALTKNHTWDLVTLPPGQSLVGCNWIYKIKTRSDGSVERYKARLVAKVTRPDISYVVHQVSQYLSAPRSTHYAAVLRILRYLKGTLFHGLFYSAQSPLVLRAFFDVDWAGDLTDRRSTTGYCFLLGSSLISWRSKKQTFVARSSTEAEYHALADTTFELL